MLKLLKLCVLLFIAVLMVGCGGGGGNASGSSSTSTSTGTGTSSSTSTSTSTSSKATISLMVVDSKGTQVSDNAIGSSESYYVQATVKDATSTAVNTALVSFSVSDAAVVKLVDSSDLTDTLGVTQVKVQPASLSARGAVVITVTSVVGEITVTSTVNVQVKAANVTLGVMSATPAELGAFQNTAITVQALVDNVTASSGVVSATFTAKCGSFSPATVSSDGKGVITSTFQPGGTCPTEDITLTATATGSTVTSTKVVKVAGAIPSTVNFNGASNSLLVAQSVGGELSRSRLTFKVSNSDGSAARAQQLIATLSPTSINAGIQFDGPTIAPQTITTGDDGLAMVGVISGNVFVPVVVTASLKDTPTVSSTSYGVSVTSGKATQSTMSLASVSASMESWGFDSVINQLTISVSDRLGNPLPKGTVVNFVTNNGIIGSNAGGTCTLAANSTCSIAYSSINADSRPANGRNAILAYLNGEESFVDANGDNLWQAGEEFVSIGWPYIDLNENGKFDAGEQKIGLAPKDLGSCTGGYPSVANTCNASAWKGDVIVRKQIIVVQATQFANMVQTTPRYLNYFGVWISDENTNSTVKQKFLYSEFSDETPPIAVTKSYEKTVGHNSMPTGSKVSATVVTLDPKTPPTCAVVSVSSTKIPHTTDAAEFGVSLNGAADCETVPVKVTVLTPGNFAVGEGSSTSFTFTKDSFMLP